MGQNKENPGDEKEKKETQDLENKQINDYCNCTDDRDNLLTSL